MRLFQLSNGNIIYFTEKSEIGIIKTKNHSFSITKEPSLKLSEYAGYDNVYLLSDSRFFIIGGSGLITIYKNYLDEMKIQAIMQTHCIDTPCAWYEDIKIIFLVTSNFICDCSNNFDITIQLINLIII